MNRIAPNKIIGDVVTVRSGQRNEDPPTGDKDEFGMPYVVGRSVRNEDSERSKRLLTDDATKFFRSHRSPTHILHESGCGAKSNAIGLLFDHGNLSQRGLWPQPHKVLHGLAENSFTGNALRMFSLSR